jgi:quercetin dioxygenase-like cupin family protein
MSGYFIIPNELKPKALLPGADFRIAWGDKIMLSFVTMGPGGMVPPHSHPHEQGGVCLEGSMEFTIGGESRILRKGEGWMIPGGVTHSVRALDEGAYALDVFYPHREEYK